MTSNPTIKLVHLTMEASPWTMMIYHWIFWYTARVWPWKGCLVWTSQGLTVNSSPPRPLLPQCEQSGGCTQASVIVAGKACVLPTMPWGIIDDAKNRCFCSKKNYMLCFQKNELYILCISVYRSNWVNKPRRPEETFLQTLWTSQNLLLK